MTQLDTPRPDKIWLTGLIFILFSFLIFCIPLWVTLGDSANGLFIVHYVSAFGYFAILIISGKLKRGRGGLAPMFAFLILSLISCYSLNRNFNVFQESVSWWCVLLTISCINYLSLPFYSRMPRWGQYLVCTIAGVSLCMFLYLTIYLMPAYIISAIGVIALGLGLHSFVPVLFVIYTLVFLVKAARDNLRIFLPFFIGVAIVVITVIQFNIRWKAEITRVEDDIDRAGDNRHNNLPRWVAVAQDCRPTGFNERFLKTGLVYEASGTWNWDIFDFRAFRQFNEQRKHDPLIMIATLFHGTSILNQEDRIKILEALYDSRHAAQERLWRGDALSTNKIKTDVQFWPRLHLSYTEMELTVANNTLQPTWSDQQEALYTFHLPEGSAVSSLSLWINGHEEKGVFTSRHKADTAYRSIVNYEHRDPSLIHWQEGNKVIVRVFPVLPHETRRFKIGITAPLEKKGDRLIYHSSWFDGPPSGKAVASVHIDPQETLEHQQTSDNFHDDDDLHPSSARIPEPDRDQSPPNRQGAYIADWSLSFDDPGITPQTFSFNGQQYTAETAQPEFDTTDIHNVYLDLNKSWSKDDYTTLLPLLKNKKVYVWQPNNGLIELTPQTSDLLFRQCERLQFSLFPLSVISDKTHSLLISKSAPSSPSLSDLNGSDFSGGLHTWLANPGRLRLFCIGDEVSPYLKTLKECGAFSFDKGDWPTLRQRLTENRFLSNNDQPDLFHIDPAGLLIRKTPMESDTGKNKAPDHLLRLFAYRQIQQTLEGHLPGDYTDQDEPTVDTLVKTAQEAGIVSPVSSLVVLENQEDYKRFDIAQSLNGLKNASIQGKGAVPEPGEWALLGLVIVLFVIVRLRSSRTSLNAKV